jgi:hypothetical protein
MTGLNPVSVECPKCGVVCRDEDISVQVEYSPSSARGGRLEESKRVIAATIISTFVMLPPGVKCVCERTEEHLHKKCSVCGFYWSTETLENYLERTSDRSTNNNE